MDGDGGFAVAGGFTSGFIYNGASDAEAFDGGDDFGSEFEGEAVVRWDEAELDGVDGEAIHGVIRGEVFRGFPERTR